ncbi:MAG: hypothetical protein GXO21_04840 [Aquificae bacterium]|nr:hypothetical protein [Aquificota bacterium]
MFKKLAFSILTFSISTSLTFAFTEKECQEYVKKLEECIEKEQKGDLNTKWRKCETQIISQVIQEQEDQGNCFSFEECRDLVMEEIKACNKERTSLYGKLFVKNQQKKQEQK